MEVKDVATLVNAVTSEVIGEGIVLKEDLSNVIEVGSKIFDNASYDSYVKALIDHIGRVLFVDRSYSGSMVSLYRDNWDYAATMEKIMSTELPEAVTDSSFNLVDGASYDPFVFKQPKVQALFYNKRVNFEVDISICDIQVRSAFDSATQLNGFVSMLMNDVDKSISIKMSELAERTINYLIANTVYNDIPDLDLSKTGTKAVNLLKLYNDTYDPNGNDPLTVDEAIYSPEFIRFASFTISKYIKRLTKVSKLFNIGGMVRFTPTDKQHLVMLSDFKAAADVFLQSDVYHNELTALPMSEDIPYFQGSGTDYDFDSISKIHIDIEDPTDKTKTVEVNISGVLGVLFDHDAAGITCERREVTSQYNAKARFNNLFYHQMANYFVDLNENCVVFFIGESSGEG